MAAPVEQVEPDQAAFNDRTLELYQRHLSSNHLEVGVGTGYFLDRSRFPDPDPRLALLDLNPHCLKHTEARLARHAPEVYRASALAPIELGVRRFDSIAINYVLHCMPGVLPEKGIAFANLKPLLSSGGGAVRLDGAAAGRSLRSTSSGIHAFL
jgi:hypothetical protein